MDLHYVNMNIIVLLCLAMQSRKKIDKFITNIVGDSPVFT